MKIGSIAVPAFAVVNKQVLTLDIAPTILDLCGAPALPNIHGQSFKNLVKGDTTHWRDAWYYEYNYEKQFPYTPNVRGIAPTNGSTSITRRAAASPTPTWQSSTTSPPTPAKT